MSPWIYFGIAQRITVRRRIAQLVSGLAVDVTG
jgi:hypothetical protein